MVEFAEETVDDGWRVPDEMWERIRAVLPLERPHPIGPREGSAELVKVGAEAA